MSRLNSKQAFSAIEMVVAVAISGALVMAVFQFLKLTTQRADDTRALSNASQLGDEILKAVRSSFQHRTFGGGALVDGGAEVFALASPLAFKVNPGGSGHFRCADGTSPSCQNLRIVQLASTNPVDTYRKVEFQTTCSATPVFPADFAATFYQIDGGACVGPPQITMTTSGYPAGAVTNTRGFPGENILGSALCIRACTITASAGPGLASNINYAIELAILYRGSGNKWMVKKTQTSISTGDVGDGIQILPQ